MSANTLLYFLTFLSATLLTFGAYSYFTREREIQRRIERRAAAWEPTERTETMMLLRRGKAALPSVLGENAETLQDWLLQTGVPLTDWQYLGGALAGFVATQLLCLFLLGFSPVAYLAGPAVWLSLILALLSIARQRRISKFEEQLPDAIDIIARGLKAGYPLQTAVSLVAREMGDPVGLEFKTVVHEIGFGLDVETAMKNLSRRVGSNDLVFLVTAVVVQTQSGGNLADVLSRLSNTMRERTKLRLKVEAMTKEGRMTALMLTFMPPGVGIMIYILNPAYYRAVWSESGFKMMMYLAVGLLVVGNLILRKMVKFKY
ncbi:type II secretion system F family protein [Methylocystis sp. JAN1]|uniref:type II secretion system F family protein n=1 Tax=Methylocystis sp. JAN1 TaxID=3397211 RepID=UPI003FA1AA2E